jgi:hypothetical protein
MATKQTPKKGGALKPLLIGAVLIGGGYAAWEYLIKPMLNKDETPPGIPGAEAGTNLLPSPVVASAEITDLVQSADQVTPNQSGKDDKLVLKKGDDNPEVKTAQIIFNDIIDKCRKGAKLPFAGQISINPKMTVARVNQIAALSQLSSDGKFGPATEKVAQVIMGKTTFTLSEARSKRIAIYAAFNLANPY